MGLDRQQSHNKNDVSQSGRWWLVALGIGLVVYVFAPLAAAAVRTPTAELVLHGIVLPASLVASMIAFRKRNTGKAWANAEVILFILLAILVLGHIL